MNRQYYYLYKQANYLTKSAVGAMPTDDGITPYRYEDEEDVWGPGTEEDDVDNTGLEPDPSTPYPSVFKAPNQLSPSILSYMTPQQLANFGYAPNGKKMITITSDQAKVKARNKIRRALSDPRFLRGNEQDIVGRFNRDVAPMVEEYAKEYGQDAASTLVKGLLPPDINPQAVQTLNGLINNTAANAVNPSGKAAPSPFANATVDPSMNDPLANNMASPYLNQQLNPMTNLNGQQFNLNGPSAVPQNIPMTANDVPSMTGGVAGNKPGVQMTQTGMDELGIPKGDNNNIPIGATSALPYGKGGYYWGTSPDGGHALSKQFTSRSGRKLVANRDRNGNFTYADALTGEPVNVKLDKNLSAITGGMTNIANDPDNTNIASGYEGGQTTFGDEYRGDFTQSGVDARKANDIARQSAGNATPLGPNGEPDYQTVGPLEDDTQSSEMNPDGTLKLPPPPADSTSTSTSASAVRGPTEAQQAWDDKLNSKIDAYMQYMTPRWNKNSRASKKSQEERLAYARKMMEREMIAQNGSRPDDAGNVPDRPETPTSRFAPGTGMINGKYIVSSKLKKQGINPPHPEDLMANAPGNNKEVGPYIDQNVVTRKPNEVPIQRVSRPSYNVTGGTTAFG